MALRKPLGPTALSPRVILMSVILMGIGVGCATSGLVNLWKDPQNPATPMHNIFVIAVKSDPARRRIMEDGFVSALAARGVTATPSYRLFPDALPDTEQVISAVKSSGCDDVIVASKLETQTQTTLVPGYTTREVRSRYDRWTDRYYNHYTEVEHPGYAENARVVRHQVDVYSSVEGGHMVWTAVGESVDPKSSSAVTKEITNLIVPELARQHVIPEK